MGLEAATHITDLNSANPASGDPPTQGDDHLRLIKSVLLTDFAGISGAVTSTHTELNVLDGIPATLTAAELGQLDDNTFDANVTISVAAPTLNIGAAATLSTGTAALQVGNGRTGDGNSLIDLVADSATYTDYGLRIIRNSTANGASQVLHRGTGAFAIATDEAAPIQFQTDSTLRMAISSAAPAIAVGGSVDAWETSTEALQVGTEGSVWGNAGSMHISTNLYYDTGAEETYLTTAGAGDIALSATDMILGFAGSGTADTTATLTDVLKVTSTGILTLGASLTSGFSISSEEATVADDATHAFSLSLNGFYLIISNGAVSGWAIFFAGTTQVNIGSGADVVFGDAVNPDTDTKLNIWASAGEINIKNRLGAQQIFTLIKIGQT